MDINAESAITADCASLLRQNLNIRLNLTLAAQGDNF